MSSDRWHQIEELYHAALKLDASRRAAFLESACNADGDLRREVESLLASDPQAKSFLEAPVLEVAAEAMANEGSPSLVGRLLGPYQILSVLGAGGMGEVYKAKDSRLNRTVAIKILPRHLSERADLRQRFEREARALARLSHPHICPIHDVGNEDGIDFLVMEYLEGETLVGRLRKGALHLEQALQIAVEIAQALDEAHRHGVIHRDLKPGNVMLTKSGAKLLDFGLAKQQVLSPFANLPSSLSPLARGTTGGQTTAQNESLTEEGLILGTLEYMPPEQVQGKPADARTDLFALGVVLYEMVSGRKAFQGESRASLAAAILTSDPEPITTIQPSAPTALERTLVKCLNKDPEERWQSARDLAGELKWILEDVKGSGTSAISRTQRPEWYSGRSTGISVLAGTLALAVGFIVSQHLKAPQVAPDLPLRRWVLAPTNFLNNARASISPGGRSVAYTSRSPQGLGSLGASNRRLWVWQFDQNEPRELASLGAGRTLPYQFFWSPGDDFIAFASGRELRKVAVQGGDVTKLCEIPEGVFTGGAWAPDGNSIVFATGLTGQPNRLYELPAHGGSPKLLIEQREPEEGLLGPHFLPIYAGPRILLFSTPFQILLHNLDTGQRRVLGGGLRPVYAPSGHIVFQKAIAKDEIWALPFSLKRSEPTGEAFPVAKDAGFPSVARDGTLVYLHPALAERKQLIWRNRDGRKLAEIGQPQKEIFLPSLSPDGRCVGVEGVEAIGEDVWIHDVARSTKTRLTQDPARDSRAIWSPDGKEIAFWSNRNGEIEIFTVSTDGQTKPVVIDGKQVRGFPDAWSPDGQYLAYGGSPTKATWDRDICLLERKPNSHGWAKSTSWQNLARAASFSPDGHFLAYVSAESGTWEVYVRPFPEGPGKWHVSTNGGSQPRWRKDGKELFYVEGDTLIAVSVSTTPAFSMGSATRLFSDSELDWRFLHPTYDVSADGQRFVLTEPSGTVRNATIQVVQNWFAEFKR